MRTSPHSNIRRACFRWSSWSGSDDSSIRATSSTRLRTLSALSAFTRLRSPWLMVIRTMVCRCCSASCTAGRPVPKRSIRSRSEGSGAPAEALRWRSCRAGSRTPGRTACAGRFGRRGRSVASCPWFRTARARLQIRRRPDPSLRAPAPPAHWASGSRAGRTRSDAAAPDRPPACHARAPASAATTPREQLSMPTRRHGRRTLA